MARLLAPSGPARFRRVGRAGAEVVAVPGRYCVTHLLLGPGSVGVVDLGSQADIPVVLDALRGLGRLTSEVCWVAPSHLHFDHVLAIDVLARRLGVPILLGRVAHDASNGRRRLRFPSRLHLLRAVATWPMQGLPFPPLADWRGGFGFGFPGAPNRFHADLLPPLVHGAPLPRLPGWFLLDGPGHADDAVLFHHPGAGFLVAGDTVRNFYGGEWNPLLCDRADYSRTQALIRSLPVDTIFPAHGPIVDGPDPIARLRTTSSWMP
ncbi:MAG: MBL fold metallo-hydrolase [Deltaproteobacteria bacterium]|nr:MBL fold metallo-hydrolase [Deltaproteobacteria bacterium]